MAAESSYQAVRNSGVGKIERVVVARDLIATRKAYSILLPIMEKLEREGVDISDCSSVDVCNYCPGFVHGLNIASLMVGAGQAENVLIVASTDYTDMIVADNSFNSVFGAEFDSSKEVVLQYSLGSSGNYQAPRFNAFLWGCGAGAVVVGSSEREGIKCFKVQGSRKLKFDSYGIGEETGGKSFGSLDGKAIYRYAMTEVPDFIEDFLRENEMSHGEVGILIPHQPNPRILNDLAGRIEIPKERMLVSCDYLGNMIAASAPVTYHLGKVEGKIKSGDNVMFCSFGDSYLTTSGLIFTEK